MMTKLLCTTKNSPHSIDEVYNRIAPLIRNARISIVRTIDTTMVQTYWNIGKHIVEEEQRGGTRAEYGKELLRSLSARLTKEFGKGFGQTTLEDIRKFYIVYSHSIPHAVRGELDSQIVHALCGESLVPRFQPSLSWSHYRILIH